MSGAWGKGPNSAVNSAPSRGSFTIGGDNSGGGGRGGGAGHRNSGSGGRRNNNNNNNRRGSYNSNNRRGGQNNNRDDNDNNNRGGGRGRGRGGRGRGRGGGRGGNNDNRNSNRIYHKDVQLLNETGLGKTKEQQRVKRINNREFMRLRLEYLEPSESVPFTPHEQCHWVDDDREEVIKLSSLKAMELGDVSKNNNRADTAPPMEACAPLAVNEETRWKSKAMRQNRGLLDEVEEAPPETTEEIVAHTRLILNKVSWTTLDRMTDQFVETAQIETNEDVRKVVIHLLIQKSQMEHHFGPLYANLCGNIAKKFKPFKKELLTQCQHEFEKDTAEKIADATKGMTDKDEIEYHTMLIRKAYLGHMKFLGELYKHDVVKLAIMMYCLDELLKETENEDSLECFAELMTTIGSKLDVHAKQNNKPFDWDRVVNLRKSDKISNRIKFLLQDLLDLKNNNWVSRRKKESAVNLKDLHKEIAKEQKGSGSNNKQNNRRSSASQASTSLRRTQSVSSVPVVDNDGFVEINRSSLRKVGSKVEILQPEKDESGPSSLPAKSEMRRTQSQPANMMVPNSPTKGKKGPVLSPDECGTKAKNMLKEYFVGGDTDDAILTVAEVIQAGTAGDVERGAKFVESSVFLVMEMKKEQAQKCAVVLSRAFKEGKIPADSFTKGLSDPLEFLNDVEIDAPLAGSHLAHIVAEAIKVNALELDPLLKNAPQDFKEFGKPAVFCGKVLKALGKNSDADMEMIGSLMTDFEKTKYETAQKLYETV